MRQGIHPKWFPEAKLVCLSCGTEWHMGSTRPELRVDVCSNCHPFYTGEQRIVDTEGQVDRFMKRLQAHGEIVVETDETAKVQAELPIESLDLGKQYTELLTSHGIKTANDFIKKLEEGGDDAILDIRGIGRKVLTDAKKRLRKSGYTLPQSSN